MHLRHPQYELSPEVSISLEEVVRPRVSIGAVSQIELSDLKCAVDCVGKWFRDYRNVRKELEGMIVTPFPSQISNGYFDVKDSTLVVEGWREQGGEVSIQVLRDREQVKDVEYTSLVKGIERMEDAIRRITELLEYGGRTRKERRVGDEWREKDIRARVMYAVEKNEGDMFMRRIFAQVSESIYHMHRRRFLAGCREMGEKYYMPHTVAVQQAASTLSPRVEMLFQRAAGRAQEFGENNYMLCSGDVVLRREYERMNAGGPKVELIFRQEPERMLTAPQRAYQWLAEMVA